MTRHHKHADSRAVHGCITAAFGRHYEVELDDGTRLQCYPRGKKSVFACGDAVDVALSGDGQGVITALQPRRNLLWRSDAFREKLIAANLTQVVLVVATEPGFSPLLISRCIAAAESQDIRTLIVLNKCDLTAPRDAARAVLAPFARLGYPILELSALEDVAPLRARLEDEHSIFVGQSGMGKSTLTNALIPEAQARTREISDALNSGKHTTTFARLYPIDGGWLIDSPGLQAFGLAHLSHEDLFHGFTEFRELAGQCRFRDCHHDAEPGCALREAVDAGRIDAQRFDHYHQIRDEIDAAKRQSQGY